MYLLSPNFSPSRGVRFRDRFEVAFRGVGFGVRGLLFKSE